MKASMIMMVYVLCCVQIACSQEKRVKKQIINITDCIEVNRVEKVMKHKEELLFDNRGNKIGEIEYNHHNGAIKKEVRYAFNDKNQIVYRKEILPDHSNFFTETTFKYSPLNDEEPAEMKGINSKGLIAFIVRHQFDEKGRIIKEVWLDNEDTTKINRHSDYIYDDKNGSMEEFTYFEGEPSGKLTYKYDESGRLVEINEAESSFTRIEKIEYKDSVKTREEWMIIDEVKRKVSTETFDQEGKILKRIMYREDNEQVFKVYDFKYHYSNLGKLIKEETYENDKLKQEKVYEYEYYN